MANILVIMTIIFVLVEAAIVWAFGPDDFKFWNRK